MEPPNLGVDEALADLVAIDPLRPRLKKLRARQLAYLHASHVPLPHTVHMEHKSQWK